MKVSSFKLAVTFFLYPFLFCLASGIFRYLGDFGLELGRIIGLSIFLFFYFFYGVFNKFFHHFYVYSLDEWLITPLGYAILTYLIDRFVLTRFTQRLWFRVPILLIIFAAMSIYAFWLFPPFGK